AGDAGGGPGGGGRRAARRRTAVGPFAVADGLHVPARGEGDAVELPLHGLGTIAARVLPTLLVDEEQSAALGNGRRIRSEDGEPAVPAPLPEHAASAGDRPVAALDAAGRLIAIVAREGASWRPLLVVPVDARC